MKQDIPIEITWDLIGQKQLKTTEVAKLCESIGIDPFDEDGDLPKKKVLIELLQAKQRDESTNYGFITEQRNVYNAICETYRGLLEFLRNCLEKIPDKERQLRDILGDDLLDGKEIREQYNEEWMKSKAKKRYQTLLANYSVS